MLKHLLFLIALADMFFIVTGSCGGDPNAVKGCGNCGKSCGQTTKICPDICEQNECTCKTGFSFNPSSNKCVPSNQCPLECGSNEIFSQCTNNICSAVNCTQLGNPIPCDRPDVCKSGCVCKAGFFRDNDGNCIARDSCQAAICPNENEVFDPCPPPCSPQTCASIGEIFNCPLIPINPPCNPACRCMSGFLRNSSGVCVSENDCDSNDDNNDDDDAVANFNQGNNAFTGEFLFQLFKINNGQSFIASPFSVLIPLAQLCLFAEGITFDQIIDVLNLENKDQIRTVFPEITQNYKSQQQIELKLTARIFADADFPLTENFLQTSLEVFQSQAQNIDFSDPDNAANIVNSAISEDTNGKITDLVSPSFFDASTRLVLTDAIFFLGNWTKPFDEQDTMDRDFFTDNDTSIQIPTMFQMDTFNYFDSDVLASQVLQLFYKGGNVSCVIVLPREREGINDVITKVRDGTEVLSAINNATFQEIRLLLPKFNITTNTDLTQVLQQDNITSIFDDTSDLEGITESSQQLVVSKAIQKAIIELNEKGTLAVAANAIGVSTAAVFFPPPTVIDFIADHPFLYYIFLQDSPIFCGCFSGPQS